jgi:hypothetical protein
VATAALGGTSQTLVAATVAVTDAEFSATTAIHPNPISVVTPGLVLPAWRVAQLPLEPHAAPSVDAAMLTTVMGRLADDLTRARFGVPNRQSSECPHQYAAQQGRRQDHQSGFH